MIDDLKLSEIFKDDKTIRSRSWAVKCSIIKQLSFSQGIVKKLLCGYK